MVWLTTLAILIYTILLVWIIFRIQDHFEELLPDARVNADAEEFPDAGEWMEQNSIKR